MELSRLNEILPQMRTPPTLALTRVCFTYSGKRGTGRGVEDLNFSIYPGEIVGLLGPNGAGKTTTIKILAGLLLPTSGTVELGGKPLHREDLAVLRRDIGYAPCGERGLYPRLTAQGNLELFAALHNLPRRDSKKRIQEVLGQVDLLSVALKPVNQLSRGMRQRLHIARALLHKPKLLLVDEPTLGVDPEASRAVRLLLKSLSADGTAIVLATNYLPEASDLCSRLVVLHEGQSAFDGPVQGLVELAKGRIVSETLLHTLLTDDQIVESLAGVGEVTIVRRGNLCLIEVVAQDSHPPNGSQVSALLGTDQPSWHAYRTPTLEDAYNLLSRSVRAKATK